jgi:predicted N-acyltransferase
MRRNISKHSGNGALHAEITRTIHAAAPADWNRLRGTDFPFMRHEFLAALESAGCVGTGSGWDPHHVLLRGDDDELLGAMPLYSKTNSWGEFVFDWAWADAYHRAGIGYYPKLVSAVPYTPASSPRFLVAPGQNSAQICRALLGAAVKCAKREDASSLHVLFPDADEARILADAGLLIRKDCQFHWHNDNYADFEDFLGEFTAAKRKKVKRERRRVHEAGISFRILSGEHLDADTWGRIMPLYASSFWRRGREPYLNAEFFLELSRRLPDSLVVFLAEHRGEPIATAICYRGRDALFGRYWGSAGRYHSLHFETCYYQGIEYCIAQGISRFEPGTQGEHKISRGFVPTETWSAHWLSHPQFAAAIDDYLDRERDYIDEYISAAREHVPYRKKIV